MSTLKEGSTGADVVELQKKLQAAGFDPGSHDGEFGPGTEAAVRAFQTSEGLTPDGIAGPQTLAALGLSTDTPADVTNKLLTDITGSVTVAQVSKICPGAPLGNIKQYLPDILKELSARGLGDKAMILMALGTIRAETAGFEPISEFKSRFNTSPQGHPFDLYDNRRDLGNRGAPDGANFKGRGFVQLTGRANYTRLDGQLGLGGALVSHPEKANDSDIAAQILAQFIKNVETRVRNDLRAGDLHNARRAINGGTHGVQAFIDAYDTGKKLL